MMRFFFTYVLFFGLIAVLFHHCYYDKRVVPDNSNNPFSNTNGSTDTTADPDPNSITGIHKNILSARCAVPGCHDGSFEPDYRTIQSSYSTLVYHPVIKQLDPWRYRVLPYDTANSWLWQRINHDLIVSGTDTSQGQMPLYDLPLSASELQNISNWIMNGAKDMFGNPAVFPNMEPTFDFSQGVFIPYDYLQIVPFQIHMLGADTNRLGGLIYNPFKVHYDSTLNIAVALDDDSTAVPNLLVNTLKLSFDKNDFSGAQSIVATYNALFKYWVASFKVSNFFNVGDTVYFRYYVNDGDHAQDTEFPKTQSDDFYKTYSAFYVTP